jgi:UDP-N-acetylglucosamine--N-acetylmuramyl-(pentapeptide) pyrophosphoryl-undecaprenol N-acetylglucosamine transferase
MKILMTGGGSGGHITPILAVADEIKRLEPECELIYVGQRGDGLADIPAADPNIDAVYSVWAGKLRRYADEGWRQWLHVRTQLLNLRDIARVIYGIWQSYWLVRRLKPDVVFTRGGFVSVPVAFGARLNGVPYITHDADSIPSLANRLIASGAIKHAVALPAELYPYPAAKTVVVGVPVHKNYELVTEALRAEYRKKLKVPAKAKMVFLTGGGNGARALNHAMLANARYLLTTFKDLVIVHVAGRALEAETKQAYDALNLGESRKRVVVRGFVSDSYRYSGAADIIIARGGATSLAEFALQRVACLIVPSKQLGWNVKNAEVLAREDAVVSLHEEQAEQPERLGRVIGELLEDDKRRQKLAHKLAVYARPNATHDLAQVVLDIANNRGGKDAVRKV